MIGNKIWFSTSRALVVAVTLALIPVTAPSAWAQADDSNSPERTRTAWTTWKSWDGNNPGTVVGSIVLGDQEITVTYTGDVDFVQLNGNGTNYYLPGSTFKSSEVPNTPPGGNMIAISGTPDPHNFAFSAPVKNPVMAFVSLGNGGDHVAYNFTARPRILIQGPGQYYGGGHHGLRLISKNAIQGIEGNGLIQFTGKFTTLGWTNKNGEYWTGFTVGTPLRIPGD